MGVPVPRGPWGEPGVMMRFNSSLRDYLPVKWAEIQARYNRPLDVAKGCFTTAEANRWKFRGPRGANTSVVFK
jgi:hypothetical protein